MTSNPIQIIKNRYSLDRREEPLGSIWTRQDSPTKPVRKQGPFIFTGKDSEISSFVSTIIDSASERLLISTQSFSDIEIIQATERALKRGARVYMVLDSVGFEAMVDSSSCSALLGHVLLRERQERGLDLVLADWHLPARKGVLLSTPLDGTLNTHHSGWAMSLSKIQIDEFSAHVQHEFWSIREGREILSPDEVKNPPPIAEAPFTLRGIQNQDYILRSKVASDGDDSTAEKFLRKEKKWTAHAPGNSNKCLIILDGEELEIGASALKKIYSSPENTEPSAGINAHSGFSLQLAIGKECYLAGWDRSATGNWQSLLRLNAEQSKAAKALFEMHVSNPEWVGHSSITMGEAGKKIIRNGIEMEISDTQNQDMSVQHLQEMPDSDEGLHNHKPELIPSENLLALECEFKWVAAPPVLPTSASEDGLHKEWKDAKNEISKRLKALDESNVVSKIPGFGRKAKELKKTILELTSTVESIDDPKSLSDMIDNVEKLTEAVGGNLDAMKAAEDEEARQKLEDKQRAAHNAAVEKANKTIKDLEPRLKKRKTELDKLKKAVKKAKDVEKSKLESDIETLSPKIKQLDAELSKAKLTSSAKFEFKAPATLLSSKKKGTKTHKFLGDTRNSKLNLSVPKEGLPQFGTLYEAGTERYLAVSDWTHVVQGRKDAKRLKATLCAPREVLK